MKEKSNYDSVSLLPQEEPVDAEAILDNNAYIAN